MLIALSDRLGETTPRLVEHYDSACAISNRGFRAREQGVNRVIGIFYVGSGGHRVPPAALVRAGRAGEYAGDGCDQESSHYATRLLRECHEQTRMGWSTVRR